MQRLASTLVFGLLVAACTDSGSETTPNVGSGAAAGQGGSAGSGASAGKSATAGSGTGGGATAGRGAGGGSGSAAVGGSGSGAGTGSTGSGGASGGNGSGGSAGRGASAGRAGDSSASGAAGDDGAAGAPNAGLEAFKLVVIGSSTAAGEGASSSAQGWVSLLAAALEQAVVTDFDADNIAQGGYTTIELLPDSGDSGGIDDALGREPNLVILSLAGSNDLSAGTSTNTFLSRLDEIEAHANDAGVPIFFVSTAPKDLSTDEKETLRDWALEMKDRYSSCWVPGRSSAYSPCFIDIFAPLANGSLGVASEYSAGDGIHLNDAGHEVIFEAARAIVEPYVCSMTECR